MTARYSCLPTLDTVDKRFNEFDLDGAHLFPMFPQFVFHKAS
jgi:hypothetical protein